MTTIAASIAATPINGNNWESALKGRGCAICTKMSVAGASSTIATAATTATPHTYIHDLVGLQPRINETAIAGQTNRYEVPGIQKPVARADSQQIDAAAVGAAGLH